MLVREGLAWAFVRYSSDYADQEVKAKTDRLSVHAHGCACLGLARYAPLGKEEG